MEGVAAADFDDADVVASFEEGLEATMNETTVTVTGATDARRRRRLDDAPATTVLFEMLSRRPSADLAADLDAALATGVLAHRLRARSAAFATVVPLTVVVAFPDPTPGPTPGPSTPTPTTRPQSVAPTAAPTVGCDADDPPPRVVEVVFDDSGATVDVAWDAETDLGGGGVGIAFACGSILDFPGATDATCYWSDEMTVRADVASAAIVPGDNATALGGVLRRACVVGAPAPRACACHPYANASSTVVLPPENPPAPAIVLEAPETVSRCEGGFVSALQSGGSGGRDFTTVAWSIAEPGAAWAAVPSTATKWYELVLNASHLNVSSLDVRLELANFLGGARAARTRRAGPADEARETRAFVEATTRDSAGTAEAAVRLKVQGGTPPTLTFVGARERTVLVADGVEVDARGVATSCDGRPMSGRAVSYAWDVVDAVTGARLPLASSSRDARKFAAGAGALAPGAYDLVATVVDDAYGFATNGSVRLRVERSALVARVDGGDRTVPLADGAVAVASASYDPDDMSAPLVETWSCAFGNDACGVTADAETGATVALDRGAGAYVVTLVAAATDGREATAVATFEARAADFPRVSVAPRWTGDAVVANARLVVDASLDGAGEATYEWTAAGSFVDGAGLADVAATRVAGDAVVDGATTVQSLVLRAGALVPGATYAFSLRATWAGAADAGEAAVTAHVAAPPTAGVLRVAPEAGEAVTTKFELATSSWASTELPLTYAFFAAADAGAGDTTVLKTGSLAAALVAALPEGTLALRARATDSLGASGDAFAAATATAPTGGLNETVGLALAEAAALDAPEDLCQVVAAAAGLLGSETRRRLQLDDAAAGELFDALLGALDDARGMADASSDGVAQFAAALRAPVRATAGGAPLAADRARLALGQARNLSLDLRATATGGDARDSSAGDLASVVADVLASDLFAVGARRRLDATAAGADVAGAVDDIATALVAGAVDDEAPAAVASGGLAIAAARASASAALDAGGAAAEYTSPDGPFVVALSALDGAGYHAAPVAAAKTLRFSRSAAAGDGRRRLANATFSGNVTLAVPAGDARGAAATGAVANATVYCPWNYVGPVYGTCPADNSTVEYACDRVGGEFRVLCGELLVDACVGWDGGAWDPGACAEDPERSTANATACVCALPEDGGARDYSTATTARSFAKAYLRNLVGPVDPEKSAVILGFLGVIVFASALAAICGHRLDKRDATLRRGRRLVLSHSSSFLLGASTRDLAKTLGDKRATHGGAPPLIHLPGSRPRNSPNDEEAASPADERGADMLAAGWRARRVRSLFRGAFRPKSSSRAQVAPLRRRVSAAAPADDGVAEGLQGSAAAGRADHRVGGADRHAHGGRGARDAAGVPGPEVRRAKVGPEMSKVHGGLQRPRALPVGRRERDLQRQPAAGRRLWRLFAPAGGALRHRDHAAVPEGVRVGRARRPGADLALLGAPVARRRGCGRAGRARGAGGRRARGARRSLRSRVGMRLCSV